MDCAAPSLIIPDWPAPARVRAVSTTRLGGVSGAPYNDLNLGDHVGDDPLRVKENRRLLAAMLDQGLHYPWLQQVHGTRVVEAGSVRSVEAADGAVTADPGVACLVMTADCLPVLFCNRSGTRVAAAHAGWRGLADGVLEATVAAMNSPADEVLCWLGPAIGPGRFEVGDEVRTYFCDLDPRAADAFRASAPGKWLADLYRLARIRLTAQGVASIFGGGLCTFSDSQRFFSYRRDGVTGRMASLIWLTN